MKFFHGGRDNGQFTFSEISRVKLERTPHKDDPEQTSRWTARLEPEHQNGATKARARKATGRAVRKARRK